MLSESTSKARYTVVQSFFIFLWKHVIDCRQIVYLSHILRHSYNDVYKLIKVSTRRHFVPLHLPFIERSNFFGYFFFSCCNRKKGLRIQKGKIPLCTIWDVSCVPFYVLYTGILTQSKLLVFVDCLYCFLWLPFLHIHGPTTKHKNIQKKSHKYLNDVLAHDVFSLNVWKTNYLINH